MTAQEIIGGIAGIGGPLVIVGLILRIGRPWNIRKKVR